MPIFKDRVASEACPAKTAESVSYAATFALLGWLLASNYSGLGHAELDAQLIINADTPLANTSPPVVYADTEALNQIQYTAVTLRQPDILLESSNFASAAPIWHTEMEQFPQFESHPHLRAFPTAAWNQQTSDAGQQIEGYIEGLNLTLPLIDSDYLFNAKDSAATGYTDDLAGNTPTQSELIRELTVTGTETKRLSSRTDNIQRPQIPRPYRAQQIQRSFVLPPRIQALRP